MAEHSRRAGRTVRVDVLCSDAPAGTGEGDHMSHELLRRRLVQEHETAVNRIERLVGGVRQRVGLNQLHPRIRCDLFAGCRQQPPVTINANHVAGRADALGYQRQECARPTAEVGNLLAWAEAKRAERPGGQASIQLHLQVQPPALGVGSPTGNAAA